VSDEQREAFERLERRVGALEEVVRRLIQGRALTELPSTRQRPKPIDVSAPTAPPATATGPSTPLVPASQQAAPSITNDLEQWFGQRGLLVVGVLALLAAVAFFLKYAFDRGWIPPLLRALAAIAAGIAVAVWGEQRIRGGMRRYGAAMIGAGGGLVFLGLWAAAGPYDLIDRRVGILVIAASTVAVTMIALRHEIEGLAIWALVGAYLAPLVLPPPVPDPNAFLGYLEVIGLGTGLLAYTMGWRRTFDFALFGYLFLAVTGASAALPSPAGSWLLASAAVLTLHVTRQRAWPEARLGVLLIAWILLIQSLSQIDQGEPGKWLALGAAGAVWGLLGLQQLARDPFTGTAWSSAADLDPAVLIERMLFVANALTFLFMPFVLHLTLMDRSPGLVPGLLGSVYLAAGWLRRSASHLLVGFAFVALAMALEWQATTVVVGWMVLAGAALITERAGHRPGGRVASLGLAACAFICLFTVALASREDKAPTFGDSWALALYFHIAATTLCARWWGIEAQTGGGPLWILIGAAVFAGGSIEFRRFFGQSSRLAGDLALSIWWLVYAGALVSLGFRLDRKQVRSAGLAVAAGAGLKIVLYDLSNLEALYRVASFFALALIALAVAYAYNRRAAREPA
jgi:hypothetical protein